MTARDATSSDHQPIELGRYQGPRRYFVDICRRLDVVVEGTVVRRRAMDIDSISSDSDDIFESAPFHEVIQGDLVISYDPAGFTYPDGPGGVEQPAVGHARKLGTEEFEQVEDLLSGDRKSDV